MVAKGPLKKAKRKKARNKSFVRKYNYSIAVNQFPILSGPPKLHMPPKQFHTHSHGRTDCWVMHWPAIQLTARQAKAEPESVSKPRHSRKTFSKNKFLFYSILLIYCIPHQLSHKFNFYSFLLCTRLKRIPVNVENMFEMRIPKKEKFEWNWSFMSCQLRNSWRYLRIGAFITHKRKPMWFAS